MASVCSIDLAGKTELEQCQVDAIVDTLDDFMSRFPWAEKKQDIKVMWSDCYHCNESYPLAKPYVRCFKNPFYQSKTHLEF